MADRELERSKRTFMESGGRILGIGAIVALAGGLVWLLGTGTSDVVQGVGGMIATLGGVIATVGLALLAIAAVTHRMARQRPFA
jgi:hypothetical protein